MVTIILDTPRKPSGPISEELPTMSRGRRSDVANVIAENLDGHYAWGLHDTAERVSWACEFLSKSEPNPKDHAFCVHVARTVKEHEIFWLAGYEDRLEVVKRAMDSYVHTNGRHAGFARHMKARDAELAALPPRPYVGFGQSEEARSPDQPVKKADREPER